MSEFMNNAVSRRRFLTKSLTTLAAAGLPVWYAREVEASARAQETPARLAKNDTIQIAVIGPGGSKGGYRQGLGDTLAIANHPGVKVVAACDVDKQHREEAAQHFGSDCAKFSDFRDVLARKDVDAVVIGTPDHWHVLIAIAALRAGKDVYCEKPLTLTIDEGKHLTRVAKETGRVFQVGSQQRSDGRFRLACELVRNGRLGKLKKVTAHLPTGPTGGPYAVQPVPSDLDWKMWQGPTSLVDYVPERTHGSFRWWLEYSGGMMTDWGAHHNDIAQWGMGTDDTGPVSVEALGRGPMIGTNCYNIFPEFDVTYTYADGTILNTTNKGENGVTFDGENGTIFVTRGAIKASDQRLLDDPLPANATRLYTSNDHHGNWLDCIRSRKAAICTAEIGHRSATICHLGNISLRLGGRKLHWDPKHQEFIGDREANTYLSRKLQNGWHY